MQWEHKVNTSIGIGIKLKNNNWLVWIHFLYVKQTLLTCSILSILGTLKKFTIALAEEIHMSTPGEQK